MITFCVGLVIRIGARSLQFKRDLGETGQLQFEYLDNFEIVTLGIGRLYAKILGREIEVVSQGGQKVHLTDAPTGGNPRQFPATLSDAEVGQIEFRLSYVKQCIRARIPRGSIDQLKALIKALPPRTDSLPHPSAWTVRSWIKRYIQSGNNAYRLLDRRHHSPHQKRLKPELERQIDEAIVRHYLQPNGVSIMETSRRLKRDVDAINRRDGTDLPVPSASSVARRIRELDPFVVDYKRLGPAFARNKWRYSLAGDCSTRVLERVEVDHTWLDLWVLDPTSGVPIGRPWITVLIDRYSGYILGFHVSFYGPSVGSVAAAMRNSILPKDEILGVVPDHSMNWSAMGSAELYVCDNGLEFHAKAFLRLVWQLRADVVFNPVRQPWLKSSIERCMMEVCRILPARGKVYAPEKNMVPQDPRKGAAILFDDLCIGLLLWAADRFPKGIHPKRLVRPLDMWEEGRMAAPLPMFPLDMRAFDIVAGVATQRTIDGDGVFFHYLRYNSHQLQEYRRTYRENFRTEVRFNPDNLGHVYVLLPHAKSWIQVELQRPGPTYGNGLSLIQHQIIRAEAGEKLTRLNAELELERALVRLNDHWGEAISRGVKVRRHGELIRLQGLTSAKVFSDRLPADSQPQPVQQALPVISKTSELHLAEVMPFNAFSLDEEFA